MLRVIGLNRLKALLHCLPQHVKLLVGGLREKTDLPVQRVPDPFERAGKLLSPSRPDLARPGSRVKNPRAARLVGVEEGAQFSDRANTADIPILGTEGHRYQKRLQVGGMGAPLPDRPGAA